MRGLRCSLAVAAALASAATMLSGAPVAAQFFNPFEALFGRPPAPVPRQPAPQQGYPEDARYPGQSYPGPASRAPPPGGVESESLPPPPGSAALDPYAPGQRPPRGAPLPADTSPQPGDQVMAEPPPPQEIENKGTLFSGLDKITGRIINFDAAIGETVQYGALQVTPRACYTRPPTETPNTDAFVEVDEVTLQGEVKRIFTGWMFAASPGLHAVEHPIYDVWLTDCKNPVVAAAAPPEPPAAAAAPAKPAAAPARRPVVQRTAPPPR